MILSLAMGADDSLPDDVITLKAMLRNERAARLAAEAEARARTLLIEKLKLTIKKLRHERFGQSSERGTLLDQLELQLADLEENAAQAETAVQLAAEKITVPSFERRRPGRGPLGASATRTHRLMPRPSHEVAISPPGWGLFLGDDRRQPCIVPAIRRYVNGHL